MRKEGNPHRHLERVPDSIQQANKLYYLEALLNNLGILAESCVSDENESQE